MKHKKFLALSAALLFLLSPLNLIAYGETAELPENGAEPGQAEDWLEASPETTEAGCPHTYSHLGTPTYSCSPLNYDVHAVNKNTPVICDACGVRISTIVADAGTAPHTLNTYDSGHQPGGMHQYTVKCMDCGQWFSSYVIACNGPPCPIINEIPVELLTDLFPPEVIAHMTQ